MSAGILACMLVMAPQPDVAKIVEASWSATQVVGHRGAASEAPENTLESFRRAIDAGAVATECDVHVSRDGRVVVMHDATLDRTTSLSGLVAETDSATLRAAGIPFLEDVIGVTRGKIVLVVEIKAGQGVERKVVDLLRANQTQNASIVFSFKPEVVAEVERLDPARFTTWLVAATQSAESIPATLDRAKSLGIDGVGVSYKNCPSEFVKAAHARRMPVFVWTVPPGPEVDRLKGLGVNFIITDHPREVRAQLAR